MQIKLSRIISYVCPKYLRGRGVFFLKPILRQALAFSNKVRGGPPAGFSRNGDRKTTRPLK
jgi:hypothetical protein